MGASSAGHPSWQFRFTHATTDGVTTIRCSGRLRQEWCETFKQQVKALIPGCRRMVFDLTDLESMDSSGLAAIVSLYASCRTAGCPLELINLSRKVRELLGLTKVLSLFEACGSYMVKIP